VVGGRIKGKTEIQKIRRDVEEKLTDYYAGWAIMMVFASNLSTAGLNMLSCKFGIRSDNVYSYSFPTFNVPGDQAEFCLLALVAKSPNE
jgi:hypothetical protein